MVPISKSIWPLILFVCANFYFVAITRFNSSFCFLKIFSRERSSPPPPNFAPPFCAFCLIVCVFLSKTWNLRRKEGKSAPSRENAMSGSPQAARLCSDDLFSVVAYSSTSPLSKNARPNAPGPAWVPMTQPIWRTSGASRCRLSCR